MEDNFVINISNISRVEGTLNYSLWVVQMLAFRRALQVYELVMEGRQLIGGT